MYNFHPGSHVGQGVDKGISLITDILNKVIQPEQTTCILLETMSGKGTEIGSKFLELKQIIDRTEHAEKLGVCLDTCHVFAGGYDIIGHLDDVLSDFDKVIGLKKLKAIHLNDSLKPFDSHKDRHEKIGHGLIGLDALAGIINHPALRDKPFYLETPHEELSGYADEIALLKGLYRG
jgi:deoxyribonuclease-4